jgi:hypothetical protein
MSSNNTFPTDIVDDDLTISDTDTISIDTSSLSGFNMNTYSSNYATGSYTIANTGAFSGSPSPYGNITISNGASSTPVWTTGANHSTLKVSGNAEFDEDVTIKGVSILKQIEKINERLAILVPDPAKLEHFAALKKAYEHYKTMEALCELPTKDSDV